MFLSTARIGDVVSAGVKPGFRVTLKDGRQITSSADHRFLFADGWSTLAEATGIDVIADRAVWKKLPSLYVNGKPLTTAYLYSDADWLRYQYHTRGLGISEIAELAQCSTHTVRKYLRLHGLTLPERSEAARFMPGLQPWNLGLSYSFLETVEQKLERSERAKKSVLRGEASNFSKGGVSTERAQIGRWTTDVSSFVFARDGYRCVACGERARADDPFHSHHLVPVWADPSEAYNLENLVTLHESCHRAIHRQNQELAFAQSIVSEVRFDMATKTEYMQGQVRQNGHATPHLVPIEKIEYVGEIEMFDLVVDGAYPNFIADWFVVHNSGRYTPFEENDFYVVQPDEWRRQSPSNKQSSEGLVEDSAWLTDALVKHYEEGFRLYEAALEAGVAREQARLFLAGFSVYYTWVAKIDAHNLMHFLRLRMANDAQYEIRQYALAIYKHFFKPALPWTAEAFEKFVLGPAGVVLDVD